MSTRARWINTRQRIDFWVSRRSTATLRVIDWGIWLLLMLATTAVANSAHSLGAKIAYWVILSIPAALWVAGWYYRNAVLPRRLGDLAYEEDGDIGYEQERSLPPVDASRPPSKRRTKVRSVQR